MNYFYLDKDLDKSAQALADCHLHKMLMETLQCLSTWIWHKKFSTEYPLASIRGKANLEKREAYKLFTGIYSPTHINHPVNTWLRKSDYNVLHLLCYTKALHAEYVHRRNKVSACNKIIKQCQNHIIKLVNVIVIPMLNSILVSTPVNQCMPEEYRQENPVEAYRLFYASKQYTMKVEMRWTNREKPTWLAEYDFEAWSILNAQNHECLKRSA